MKVNHTVKYLVWKPDEPGLLVVTEHPIFGIQQLFHDQEEEFLSHASCIDRLLSNKDHLPRIFGMLAKLKHLLRLHLNDNTPLEMWVLEMEKETNIYI